MNTIDNGKIIKLIDKMYCLTENQKITWAYIDNQTKKRFLKEFREIMLIAPIHRILYFSFGKGFFYLVSGRNPEDNIFILFSRKNISADLFYIIDSYESETIKCELKALYDKIIITNTDDKSFIDSFLEYNF